MIQSPKGPLLLRPGQAPLGLPVQTTSACLVHSALYLIYEGSPHVWAIDADRPDAQLQPHHQAEHSRFMEIIDDLLVIGDRRELTAIHLERATVSERFELVHNPAQLILYNTITPDDALSSLYSFTPGLYDVPHTGVWRWRPGQRSELVLQRAFGRYMVAQDEPFVWEMPSPIEEPTYELSGIDFTLQHPLGMHIEHIARRDDQVMLVGPRYIVWMSTSGQLLRSVKRRPHAMRLDLEHASLWWAQDHDQTRHLTAHEELLIDAPLAQLRPLDGATSPVSWAWRQGKIELCGAHAPPLRFPLQAQPLHLFWCPDDQRAFAITADYALVELDVQRDAQGVASAAATPWVEPPAPSGPMQALDVLKVLLEVQDPFICSQVLHETLEPDELQWLCLNELPTSKRGFKVSLNRVEQWLEAPLLSSLNPDAQAHQLVKFLLDEGLVKLAADALPEHLEIIAALVVEASIDEPQERGKLFDELVWRSKLLIPTNYEPHIAFNLAYNKLKHGDALWQPEQAPLGHVLKGFQRWSKAQGIQRPKLEALIFTQTQEHYTMLGLMQGLNDHLQKADLRSWTSWCQEVWWPWALAKAQEVINQELIELATSYTAQTLVPTLLTNLLDRRGEVALGEELLEVEGVEELFADDKDLIKLLNSAQHWDEILLKALMKP